MEYCGMNTLYFDMQSGISGDMIAGAFCDLGLDINELRSILSSLPIADEFEIEAVQTEKQGITGTDFTVTVKGDHHHHRTNRDIREMILAADIPEPVAQKAIDIFSALARAEGAVHGKDPDDVHFHEVGAVDSIVDILTAAYGLVHFKAEACYCSPFSFGSGSVQTQHGELSVPVPAVLKLTEGSEVRFTDIPFEITTPTGAAVVTSCTDRTQSLPPFRLTGTGYGFGKKETGKGVNALRIMLGVTDDRHEASVELVTDIDDSTPETIGLVAEKLLEAGALDCTITQILMKKGRPGSRLTVLSPKAISRKLKRLIFTETTTFGIRETLITRTILEREMITVTIQGHKISCKAGYLEGELMTVSPEYEDCKAAAEKSGLSFREIYTQAQTLGRDKINAECGMRWSETKTPVGEE